MEEPKKKKKFLQCTVEERKRLAAHKMNEEKQCVPIVLEPRRMVEANGQQRANPLKRYAIRREYRVFEMVNTIQNMSKLVDKEKGLFLFTKYPKCKLLSVNSTVQEVYEKNKSEDDWLYLLYDTQLPFGGDEQ